MFDFSMYPSQLLMLVLRQVSECGWISPLSPIANLQRLSPFFMQPFHSLLAHPCFLSLQVPGWRAIKFPGLQLANGWFSMSCLSTRDAFCLPLAASLPSL
jgi:hypothetical protein